MTWKAYKLVFCLLSPMHIGWIKQGNVQRTRPYLTGKALWGALTARLTRDRPQSGDYQTVGQQVRDELAFSYFYPAVSETVDLWPWGETADEFAWRYLGSYAGTALNYGRNTAEEGSLHETEFIAPHTRNGQPVYLVGYLFERQNCNLPWREVLPRLQFGGERTYGWGRVKLHKLEENNEQFFDLSLHLDGDRPVVLLPSGKRLLAHTLATDTQNGKSLLSVRGSLEPLVGRETHDAQNFGGTLSQARICWEPGSAVSEEVRLKILEDGIWACQATP